MRRIDRTAARPLRQAGASGSRAAAPLPTLLLTIAAPMLGCERPASPASAPGAPNGPQPVVVTVSDPSTATYHPEPMPSSPPPPTVGKQERQPDEDACLRSCEKYAVCQRELFVGRDVSGRLRTSEEDVEIERQECRLDCKDDVPDEDEMKAFSECLRLTDCKAYLWCSRDA